MHAPRPPAHVLLLKLGDRIAHRRFNLALRLHDRLQLLIAPPKDPLLSGVRLEGVSDDMSVSIEQPNACQKILLALPRLPLILAGVDWRSERINRLQVGKNTRN